MSPRTRLAVVAAVLLGVLAGVVLLAFAAPTPTLPHADATQRSLGQTAVVVALILGKLKMSFRLPRMVLGPETQIFIEPIRLNHFAGIHLPAGIPESFKLTKSLDKFSPKHFGKKFRARLPVPVLARQGPSKADNQVSRLFHKLPVFANAGVRLQIKINTRVNASMAKMPVERALVPVAGHQFF